MHKLALIITSVIALSACSDGGGSSKTTAYSRVTTDQPDATQYKNTIHIVYAVPSGNEDQGRDKNYQLQKSIFAADKWLNDISGGKQLRLDLQNNGDVDITYWPMTETNAALHQSHLGMRDTIEDKLKQTDWYNPNKLYVVYFEGSHFETCGDGPTNGGHVVDFYLHNPESNIGYVCTTEQFSSNDDVHGFVEYILIHKVVRMLGAYYVMDSVKDLMSPPYKIYQEPWIPEFIDFNNDDYFTHTDSDKVDILYSAFLLPNDGDELPPNWSNNN